MTESEIELDFGSEFGVVGLIVEALCRAGNKDSGSRSGVPPLRTDCKRLGLFEALPPWPLIIDLLKIAVYCILPIFSMRFFLAILLLIAHTGCATYKKPAEKCLKGQISEREKKACHHPLYTIIPRHSDQIRWFDMGHWCSWALFGNDDDGIFGEGQNAQYCNQMPISTSLAMRWFVRNPFHNFTYYVIGSAYTTNSEMTLLSFSENGTLALSYEEQGKTVFAGKNGSSLYLGLHGWKPFFSFRLCYPNNRRSEFWFGWRERGNFGLKLIPSKKYNGESTETVTALK